MKHGAKAKRLSPLFYGSNETNKNDSPHTHKTICLDSL